MDAKFPEHFDGSKIYFTEADPTLQKHENLNARAVEQKLKAWLLLVDNIVISGTHIMSSPETHKILNNNTRLLRDGAVVPYIRQGSNSFTKYLETKMDESDSSFAISKHQLDQVDVAGMLDSETNKAIVWKPDVAIQQYQQSLIQELLNKSSTLRSKLVGITKTNIHQLAEDIENDEHISRGSVDEYGRKYLGKKHAVLQRHSNFLYYLWGSTHLECEPILHPESFNLGIEKLRATIENLEKEQRIDDNRSFRLDETSVLDRVVADYGVVADAIDRMSIDAILDLREERIAVDFRGKWQKILNASKAGSSVKIGYEDDLELLYEAVRLEIGRERLLGEKIEKSKNRLSIGSFLTSGLVTTVFPEVGVVGIAASALGVDPLIAAIQKRIPGFEISLFCARLQSLITK